MIITYIYICTATCMLCMYETLTTPQLKKNPSTIICSKAQLGAENQLAAGYMTYLHVCITPMNLLNLGLPSWDVKHPNTPQTPIPYLKDPYNQSHRYVVVNFRSRFVCSRRQLNDHPNDQSCHFFKIWLVYRHTSTASTVTPSVQFFVASVSLNDSLPPCHGWKFPSGSWGSRDFLGAGREWGPEVEVQALRGGEDLQKRRPSWVLSENVGNLKSCVWDF